MTATEQYIENLARLKTGDLGLLRQHAGRGIDESTYGFDLFAGLWWPLREKNQRAPRREVAWLVAKLYAYCPLTHERGMLFARQLSECALHNKPPWQRIALKFDQLLAMPLRNIEPAMQWALDTLDSDNRSLDWVKLTDDLSIWEREPTRIKWAENFLQAVERS